LPAGVNADDIEASISKGALSVTVSKAGSGAGEKDPNQGRCLNDLPRAARDATEHCALFLLRAPREAGGLT
jgi:hypothetical protein